MKNKKSKRRGRETGKKRETVREKKLKQRGRSYP